MERDMQLHWIEMLEAGALLYIGAAGVYYCAAYMQWFIGYVCKRVRRWRNLREYTRHLR